MDQHTIQFASLWRPQGTEAHPHVPCEDVKPAPPPHTSSHPPDPIKDADLSRLCDLVHWNVRAASYPDWVRALTLFKEEGAARGDPDLYKALAIQRTSLASPSPVMATQSGIRSLQDVPSALSLSALSTSGPKRTAPRITPSGTRCRTPTGELQ